VLLRTRRAVASQAETNTGSVSVILRRVRGNEKKHRFSGSVGLGPYPPRLRGPISLRRCL
jgi:hypothetical protein